MFAALAAHLDQQRSGGNGSGSSGSDMCTPMVWWLCSSGDMRSNTSFVSSEAELLAQQLGPARMRKQPRICC